MLAWKMISSSSQADSLELLNRDPSHPLPAAFDSLHDNRIESNRAPCSHQMSPVASSSSWRGVSFTKHLPRPRGYFLCLVGMVVVVLHLCFQVREVSFHMHAVGVDRVVDFCVEKVVVVGNPFYIVY